MKNKGGIVEEPHIKEKEMPKFRMGFKNRKEEIKQMKTKVRTRGLSLKIE
jgi:hypothetical protein